MKLAWVYRFKQNEPIPTGDIQVNYYIITRFNWIATNCVCYLRSTVSRTFVIIIDINPADVANDNSTFIKFTLSQGSFWFDGVIRRRDTFWVGGCAVELPNVHSDVQLSLVKTSGPAFI